VDLNHPSVARVYDFLLGGSAHWAIDRSFGLSLLEKFPQFRDIARAHHMFANRVVRHLTRLGVRQFLDIGHGVLSEGNTHQVADETAGGTRVVYAAGDAVAVAHAEMLLDEEGDPDRHAIVDADLRHPDELWHAALATGVLDPDEPVAVLMFSVLHVLRPRPGDDPAARVVSRYRELMPPGSYLGVSHITREGVPPELAPGLTKLMQLCDDWGTTEVHCRSHAAIDALFGELEPVCPGTGWIPDWYPEDARPAGDAIPFPSSNHAVLRAGLGRKRRRHLR
jgi:hypothetical protein